MATGTTARENSAHFVIVNVRPGLVDCHQGTERARPVSALPIGLAASSSSPTPKSIGTRSIAKTAGHRRPRQNTAYIIHCISTSAGLTYPARQVPSVRPVPDSPTLGFSPQLQTDPTGTGVPFAQASAKAIQRLPWRRQPAIARLSLPPFPVAISIVYVLTVLGTGLYFLLSN